MRIRVVVTVVVGLWLWACPRAGQAQAIRLDFEEAALEDALAVVRAQAGVDIVFAQRLVRDRRATCSYDGSEPEAALGCVLAETGLRAERVRYRQYVLVDAGGEAPTGSAAPAGRGVVAGFVVDAATGERLPGAHVLLPALQLGTVTNDAGYFAVASLPLGSYEVRFSYLGYEVLVSDLPTDTAATTIRLEPVTLEGETIVVEGSRRDRPDLAAMPGLVAVPLGRLEDMPTFPGEHDLFQALQWFPGVHKAGELNGGLVVRGGEPDQNLYLLDGAPVYHPWHAFSLISTFQTETFKDIKLYRGAFPAEHGGRLAAVLDAEMKDGSGEAPGAVVGLSTLSGRFLVETPVTRNSSVMLAGRRSYLDKLIGREHPVEGPAGARDTLRTGYYFYDLSAKYTVRSGRRHRFSASYYRGGDDLDLRLPFDLSLDFSSWLRPAELFFEVRQQWQNELFSARYQYLFAQRLFLTATAYRSSYRALEGAFLQPTTTAALHSDYRVRLADLGLRVDLDYYHSATHQLQAGLQVVDRRFRSTIDARVERSPGAVDALAEESRLHAPEFVAYVEDTWQPVRRWTLQPGLRTSFFGEGRHLRVDPTLNAQFVVSPRRLLLRAGAGTQVQYLHRLRDRYSFMYDVVSSRWIPSSADVEPSTSLQVTAGAVAHPAVWLELTADAYWRSSRGILLPEDAYRTKDGLVGPGIEVGTLLGQYTPGRGRAYGVELTARAEFRRWLVWGAYAGGRSLDRAPALGEDHFHPSRFDIPRAFRGAVRYARSRWNAALAVELRSGYPHSVPVARYAVDGPLGHDAVDGPPTYLYRPEINNGRLPPYVRLDLSLGYAFEWVGAQWEAQLLLHNLLNRRNVFHRQYDPSGAAVRVVDYRGMPLVPLFAIEMEL